MTHIEHTLKEILETGGFSLYDKLLRSFLLEAQSSYFNAPYMIEPREIVWVDAIWDIWKWFREIPNYYGSYLKTDKSKTLDFVHDIVIASPWNIESQIKAHCNLGEGRPLGVWRYKEINHYAIFYEPLNLAITYNGPHSITQGTSHDGIFNGFAQH